MKKALFSEKAPKPVGAYSQAIAIDNWLFLSGQIPLDPETNKIITGDIKAQTQQIFKNINAVLQSHKMDFSNVIKATIFLTNSEDFLAVDTVYSSFFKTPFPARSCVTVKALPKSVNVEIEVTAYK